MGIIAEQTAAWAKPGLLQRGLAWSGSTTARHGTVALLDQGVVSATNFLTGVIIARTCSKEELGLYMLGFSLVLLLADLQTNLIATPYMVYAPRLRGDARVLYTGSTLIHQLGLCFLTVLGLAGGGIAVKYGIGPHGLGPVLWALVAVASLLMLREYARRVSFACLKITRALLFDSGIAVVQLGGLLLLARFGWLSASKAYWAIGLACGIAVLSWLWSERSFYRVRISSSVTDLKKNWVFGKWVFASGVVWAVSMNLYPWFLAAFHGTAFTGVWAACLGAVNLGNPALLGALNYLGPKIAHVYAEEGAESLRKFVLRASVGFACLLSLFCLAMALWGGPLVGLLYGSKYAGNGLVVALLATNLALLAIAFLFSRALFATERADLDFWVSLLALPIMITLGLWLVKSFGLIGAALGLLVANLATSVVRVGAFMTVVNRMCRDRARQ